VIAKVIRVRCKKCSAQQRFFFKNELGDLTNKNNPQLVNALDPNITAPQFLLRQGNFVHVTGHRCSVVGIADLERLDDMRICPACRRPSKVSAKNCGYRDCEAIFIRPAVSSGTKRSTVSVRKGGL